MTRDASKFTHISPKNRGPVTYGDHNKGKILGVGKIGMNPSTSIENALLVDGLKHSFLSVSQLCDKGFSMLFDSHNYFIESKHDRKIRYVGHRTNNVYMINLDKTPNHVQCFLSKADDESWLWHRRSAHINMEHLRNYA